MADSFEAGYDCVILENHGVVTGGVNLQEAFHRFETLEFAAKTIIKAKLLGGEIHFLTDEELALEKLRIGQFDTFTPEHPMSQENELRLHLAEFVRRAYRQRLFISTQGSFSVRLDASSFLITAHDKDRGSFRVQDAVLVRDGKVEEGKVPSNAIPMHQAIYRRHPEVGAIVNAYPVNASAYGVSGVTWIAGRFRKAT